jgi:hypothetical protein
MKRAGETIDFAAIVALLLWKCLGSFNVTMSYG